MSEHNRRTLLGIDLATFHDRVVESGTMAADQFTAHPDNWQIHPTEQQQALATTIDAIGWLIPLVVSQRSGYLLDGHARVMVALQRDPSMKLPYVMVDIEPEEEALALATINPLGAMAVTDKVKLSQLLEEAAQLPQADNDDLAALFQDIHDRLIGTEIIMPTAPTEAEYAEHPYKGEDGKANVTYNAYRIIQVLVDPEDHGRVLANLAALRQHFGTDTVSDTIVRAAQELVDMLNLGVTADAGRETEEQDQSGGDEAEDWEDTGTE